MLYVRYHEYNVILSIADSISDILKNDINGYIFKIQILQTTSI